MMLEDMALRRIFEYQGEGSKGKQVAIIFIVTKIIRLIRVVKSKGMRTEYRIRI